MPVLDTWSFQSVQCGLRQLTALSMRMAGNSSTCALPQAPFFAQAGLQVMRVLPSLLDIIMVAALALIMCSPPPSCVMPVYSCAINQSRTESDHSPIECDLQLSIGVVRKAVCNGVSLPKRHWNADCRNTYCDALQAPGCVPRLQAASQAASDADITSAFHHLFIVLMQLQMIRLNDHGNRGSAQESGQRTGRAPAVFTLGRAIKGQSAIVAGTHDRRRTRKKVCT